MAQEKLNKAATEGPYVYADEEMDNVAALLAYYELMHINADKSAKVSRATNGKVNVYSSDQHVRKTGRNNIV